MKIKSYIEYLNESKKAVDSLETILDEISASHFADTDVSDKIWKFKGNKAEYYEILKTIVEHNRIEIFLLIFNHKKFENLIDTNNYELIRLLINEKNWIFIESIIKNFNLSTNYIFTDWIKSDEDFSNEIDKMFEHYFIKMYNSNMGSLGSSIIFEQAYFLLLKSLSYNKLHLCKYFYYDVLKTYEKSWNLCDILQHMDDKNFIYKIFTKANLGCCKLGW